MERFGDWDARLRRYYLDRRAVPFAWGTNDCATFARGAVRALTGADVAPELDAGYSTPQGAVLCLLRAGFSSYAEVCDERLEPVETMRAGRGDVALVPTDWVNWNYGALAVVYGDACLTPGPRGLMRTPLDAALAAWRV